MNSSFEVYATTLEHIRKFNLHLPTTASPLSFSPNFSYWDETIDAGKFSKAVILDPTYGFGGNGQGSTMCIKDGPFASYVNPIGPYYTIKDHCITRQINDMMSMSTSSTSVNSCMSSTTYVTFWQCIENGPHTGGHAGINAEVKMLARLP
jgi:tyrosinase